jgi:hypothetical protein
MIELDDLTFVQLFWLCFVIIMVVFLSINVMNANWVFYPMQ